MWLQPHQLLLGADIPDDRAEQEISRYLSDKEDVEMQAQDTLKSYRAGVDESFKVQDAAAQQAEQSYVPLFRFLLDPKQQRVVLSVGMPCGWQVTAAWQRSARLWAQPPAPPGLPALADQAQLLLAARYACRLSSPLAAGLSVTPERSSIDCQFCVLTGLWLRAQAAAAAVPTAAAVQCRKRRWKSQRPR